MRRPKFYVKLIFMCFGVAIIGTYYATSLFAFCHFFGIIMNSELSRLASFSKFPEVDCPFMQLANDGYFYTGVEDELECSTCHFKMRQWSTNIENLYAAHLSYSPSCLVAKNNCPQSTASLNNNDEKSGRQSNTLREQSKFYLDSRQSANNFQSNCDVRSSNIATVTNRSVAEVNFLGDKEQYSDTCELSNLSLDSNIYYNLDNINDYRYEKNRLQTFRKWPKNDIVRPELLARDGFIYTMSGDCVQCVYCKGILRTWESHDIPSEEHNKHFPSCPFVCGKSVGNIPLSTEPRIQRTRPVTTHTSKENFESHKIDLSEIKARLDTSVVRLIMSMGYDVSLIQLVLKERLTSCGRDFPDMPSFIEKLNAKRLELELNSKQFSSTTAVMSEITSKQMQKDKQIDLTNRELAEPKIQPTMVSKPTSMTKTDKCNLCKREDINVAFKPCGHTCFCHNCSLSLTNCPMCQVKIINKMKIFLTS